MEPKSRMDEITGNLKKDMKDLLAESANIVTGFFKRGLCTVRAVADKWKTFASSISGAVDTLVNAPLITTGPEALSYDLHPDSEPIVTVVESGNRAFPIGKQMTLSEANEYVSQMDKTRHRKNKTPYPVKVKIDYMWGVTSERYWLPLQIGSGRGGLLEQMEKYLTPYRSNPELLMRELDMSKSDAKFQQDFRTTFLPFLQKSVSDLLDNLLPYFRNHCEVTEVKNHFQSIISCASKGRQAEFTKSLDGNMAILRQMLNSRKEEQAPQQARTEQESSQQALQETPPQARQSVKVRLQQLKAKQDAQPKQGKIHYVPSRSK